MLPINEENRDFWCNWLVHFATTVEYERKNNPEKTLWQLANSKVDDEIAMISCFEGMREYDDLCARYNNRLLRAIKSVKGNTFYKYLVDIIKESEGINGMASIVSKPVGTFSDEKYGRQIKGIWVDQQAVGCEGDSWAGTVCVEIKPNKFLKFDYSM